MQFMGSKFEDIKRDNLLDLYAYGYFVKRR